jgi:hypothetical protein
MAKYDVLDYRWRARWSRWWTITRPSAAKARNFDTSGGLIITPREAAQEWIPSGTDHFERPDG